MADTDWNEFVAMEAKELAEELGITEEDNADLMEQMIAAIEADAIARERAKMEKKPADDFAFGIYLNLVKNLGTIMAAIARETLMDDRANEVMDEIANAIYLMRQRYDI